MRCIRYGAAVWSVEWSAWWVVGGRSGLLSESAVECVGGCSVPRLPVGWFTLEGETIGDDGHHHSLDARGRTSYHHTLHIILGFVSTFRMHLPTLCTYAHPMKRDWDWDWDRENDANTYLVDGQKTLSFLPPFHPSFLPSHPSHFLPSAARIHTVRLLESLL